MRLRKTTRRSARTTGEDAAKNKAQYSHASTQSRSAGPALRRGRGSNTTTSTQFWRTNLLPRAIRRPGGCRQNGLLATAVYKGQAQAAALPIAASVGDGADKSPKAQVRNAPTKSHKRPSWLRGYATALKTKSARLPWHRARSNRTHGLIGGSSSMRTGSGRLSAWCGEHS